MKAERFIDGPFGAPARRPGERDAFTYYMPKPLPRELVLDNSTVMALSEADSALGLLNGLGRLVADPEVLLGPFIRKEALASSRIEGTKASLSEVLRAEAVDDESANTDDVAEVQRYLAATKLGLKLVNDLPITERLLKEIHRELMTGVRGAEKLPGELRRSPVWIGSAGATPSNAKFVPPLPEHLPALMNDWEAYVNDPCQTPPLVRAAMAHFQFETIHPFLDGNGRIGRLLIGLMLTTEGRLSRPLLYLSGFLEANREEYYDRLQAVRERGEVQEYLQFFLLAVRKQSEDAVERTGRLVELRERYYAQVHLDRSRVGAVIPLIFKTPFISAKRLEREMAKSGDSLTSQGARNLLGRAEEYGWLSSVGTFGRGGATMFVASEIFQVIEAPAVYEDQT